MILAHLVLLFGAGVMAWVLTMWAERLGHKLKLVDAPGGGLKIHARVTPRFGGLAVIVSLWLVQWFSPVAGMDLFTLPELTTASLLFALGTWDDFKPRSAAVRLLLQVLIFILSWQLGVRVGLTGTTWLDAGVAFILFIVVINAVNFYDGMDGLLALTAACALGVWAAVAADTGGVWAPFIAAAAIFLGFIPRNWHPARTFLGDGGSFVVGFLFYLVFVRSPAAGPEVWAGFWVTAFPVCDAMAATFDRLSRHGNVFAGDRDHVYDILNRLGLPAPQVALALGLFAALGARGAAFAMALPTWVGAALTFFFYLVLILAILGLRRRFHLHRDRA